MNVYYLTLLVSVALASTAVRRAEVSVAAGPSVTPGQLQARAADDEPAQPLKNPRRLTLAGLSVIAILVAVAGLRWRVGVDFAQYADSYERRYSLVGWSDLRPWSEPGIQAIAIVSRHVRDDPSTMFFLASLITVGLTVWTFYRNTTYFSLAVALYILTSTWQGSFNGVRQYLACAIVFAGHRLIVDRRFRRFALVVGLAFLCHVSAAVLLLLYWVPRAKLSAPTIISMLLTAAVAVNLYPIFGEILDSVRGEGYSDVGYFTEQVSPFRIALAFVPAAVYLLFSDREKLTSRGHFYGNMMIVHAVVFLSAYGSAYVARLAIYTGVFVPLALAELLPTRNRSLRRLLIFGILGAYAVFWYLETSATPALANFRWAFEDRSP